MLKTITIALNPFEPETWTTHETEDICKFLTEQFSEWPQTARIYDKCVSLTTDITPSCESDVKRLSTLDGPFYVVVYPGAPIYFVYALVAILVVAAVVLAQQIPNAALRNTQSQSPNNELSERTNKPRLNGRIPDIFGTVRSTPDLIAVPYKVFIENLEVEYAYMCIGRGHFEVSDIKDDTTFVSDIDGTCIEVYSPFTSPNSGHSPQLSIGDPISTEVINVVRINSVNGQVLRAPNDQTVVGNLNIRFVPPNKIEYAIGLAFFDDYDFTKDFEVGETIQVINATENASFITTTETISADSSGFFRFPIPSSTLPTQFVVGDNIVIAYALLNKLDSDDFVTTAYDLSGTYKITAVAHTVISGQDYCVITLDSPSTLNPQWVNTELTSQGSAVLKTPNGSAMFNLDGSYQVATVSKMYITLVSPETVNINWSTFTTTDYVSPTLTTQIDKWVGPFILPVKDLTQVYANFVATNGLYKDDGKNQTAVSTEVEMEITPINSEGTDRGSAEIFTVTLVGSSKTRNIVASTLKATVSFSGSCKVRARRRTDKDFAFKGSVVDEIKWRDVYSVAPVLETDFGNVTTVQSITYATAGALAIKERKLNMLVTRKVPLRVSGSIFTEELYATNKADEIFSAISLDPRIGNRNLNEIDFDSIYSSLGDVREYFNSNLAGEFSYTFDSNNLSYEETARTIAEAVHCTAYRRGNIIKFSFEKETDDSTLMFNHRNKIPGSETRTVRFGNQDNFDGVSYQYVSPDDDALVTYYIPEDRSAINPQELESLGIRSKLQAYFHAWRMWNKIKYQNTIVEFTGTQEADLLVSKDRILVADNTRPDTQDGEIVEQNVLQLTLSQSVDLTKYDSYSIFLQHLDGSVESIEISPGSNARQVVLNHAPRLPLALDEDLYARTTFMLVGNGEPRENAFLVTEKTSQGNFTSTVRAVNYDSRYYQNDSDFINGIVNENGDFV